MLDLISTTEETHYENYRQAQMETRPPGQPRPGKSDNPRYREEEEALRKRFTEQVRSTVLLSCSQFMNVFSFRSKARSLVSANGNNTSSPSATSSTKTSRSPTGISRRSKPSSIICRSDTTGPPPGVKSQAWLDRGASVFVAKRSMFRFLEMHTLWLGLLLMLWLYSKPG
jgi:hypothetical protein